VVDRVQLHVYAAPLRFLGESQSSIILSLGIKTPERLRPGA
jgi:hypothetical protein